MTLSAIANTTAAPAASVVNFQSHNHRRDLQVDAGATPGSAAPVEAPATTPGLFSRLLTTLTQVVGAANPLAATAIAVLTPSAPAAGTTASDASGAAAGLGSMTSMRSDHARRLLGARVDAQV